MDGGPSSCLSNTAIFVLFVYNRFGRAVIAAVQPGECPGSKAFAGKKAANSLRRSKGRSTSVIFSLFLVGVSCVYVYAVLW